LYQETVTAYEIVLGDGSQVRATEKENEDLFRALPWSHGSLGFLVALELKLVKVKVRTAKTKSQIIIFLNFIIFVVLYF
jgi:FAD/FMN-containing dehydrogenase